MGVVNYKIVKVQHDYQMLRLNMHWRKLPYILDKLRDDYYDIRKANIRTNCATLYIKDTKNNQPTNLGELSRYVDEVITDGYHDLYHKTYNPNKIVLPTDTEIILYNLPNSKKTTLEFSCLDRIGLLSDLLELLTVFPFELQNSYISTVGPFAHNLLFLQVNKKGLKLDDIEYIRNVFEYEVKRKQLREDTIKF